MYTYLSDFKLPKEFSKKKKLNVTIAEFVPNKSKRSSTQKWEWKVNSDTQRVHMTIEGATQAALNRALLAGYTKDDIKKGVIGLLTMEYPINLFNDFPIATAPNGDIIDAEFDEKNLSFVMTIHGRKEESANLDLLAVDRLELSEDGKSVSKFTVHPVINKGFL